jgi:hypothetical protein
MPNDLISHQKQSSAHTQRGDDLALLTANVEQLNRALAIIPHYTDQSFDNWVNLRNQTWRPLLRQLESICHTCRDLYPNADVTQHPSFNNLRQLIDQDTCETYFSNDALTVASNFRDFRLIFANIPHFQLVRSLLATITNLTTAVEHFAEDLENAPQNQVT